MSECILVVPCYNEASRLDVDAFQRFAARRPAYRFLMVDDGSRDRTAEVLETLVGSNPRCFTLLRMPCNVGKAEAVRQGILRAFESRPFQVGYWDADLATPLDAIPEFSRVLLDDSRLQVVLGSRVKLLGRRIERRAVRHYLGRLFATAASMLLRLAVYDTQCGAKMFRASPLVQRLFHEPFHSRWLFDVELLARLISASGEGRFRVEEAVCELPLMEWRDVPGSKLRATDFLRAGVDLNILNWLYGRRCAAAQRAAATRPVGGKPLPAADEQRRAA